MSEIYLSKDSPKKGKRWLAFIVAAAVAAVAGIATNVLVSDKSSGATVASAAEVQAPLGCDYTSPVLTCTIPQTTTTVTSTAPPVTVTETTSGPTATVTQTVTTQPTTTTSTTASTVPPPASIWSAPVFTDTFDAAKPAGFASSATSDPKWTGYSYPLSSSTGQDTSKRGWYRAEQASIHDGSMDVKLQTIDSKPRVFAPIPKVPTSAGGQGNSWPHNGQLGGRYSVDVKLSGAIPRYKQAFLLWPDTGVWEDGELDFPEGEFDSTNNSVTAFSHAVLTNKTQNCSSNMYRYSPADTPVNQTAKWTTSWHTYVQEWIPSNGNASDAANPGKWSVYVDGVLIHETTNPNCIPSKPMHWVLQIETAIGGAAPAASTVGNVYIDNVSIQKYVG